MKLTKTQEQTLVAHSERLEQAEEYENLPASRQAHFVVSEIAQFVEDGKRKPATATHFEQLDAVLGGGLQGGSLYVLGAISSLGKTTLALNILDNIIKNQEQEVLFFSLEMSAQELTAKLLSRSTYVQNPELALSALQIIQNPEHLSEEQKDHFYKLHAQDAQHYAKLFLTEGIGNITASDIRLCLERHKQDRGAYPVIFVDYLQMLAPESDRYTDKQNMDKSVLELKQMARDFDIPVFVISSLNRESYKDEMNMTSFKESGAIEYSSDVLLGMQLAGLKEAKNEAGNDKDLLEQKISELKQGENGIRQIELKVLKNRNGVAGSSIHFQYNAQFNSFGENLKNNNPFNSQLPT